jgi:hypothetical protein
MATKTPTPRLTASDKLLSSNILLPKDVVIACSVYSPVAGPSFQSRAYNDILETARRDVLARNGSASLTRSILTSVHVRGGDSCMYAFLIGQQGEPPTELSGLHFDGLIGASGFSAYCFSTTGFFSVYLKTRAARAMVIEIPFGTLGLFRDIPTSILTHGFF